MNKEEILLPIKNRLLSAFGKRLQQVMLFGSEGRGDSQPDSDIDILLILDDVNDLGNDLRTSLESISDLSLQWERRISIKPVSIYDFEQLDCPLFRHVREEGIVA